MPTEDQSSDRSHQGLPQGEVELSLDELAKGLATGTLSRGKALRWMGGALLGAALASVPGVAWANDCRRLGRECRRDSQCCSGNCVRRGDDTVCACPEGRTRCNDRCVNLMRNERHCGSCFNRCDEGEECVDGECLVQSGCPSGCPGIQCGTGGLGGCFCTPTAEQTCACLESALCADLLPCNTSDDCPQGTLCVSGCEGTSPTGKVCRPLCSGAGQGSLSAGPQDATQTDAAAGATNPSR
jgi:hypothetical protein